MRGYMGSDDGGMKRRFGMGLLLAWTFLSALLAMSIVNLGFGLIRGVMLGGNRFSGRAVRLHEEPVAFAWAACVSATVAGLVIYFMILAMRRALKTRRERHADAVSSDT